MEISAINGLQQNQEFILIISNTGTKGLRKSQRSGWARSASLCY